MRTLEIIGKAKGTKYGATLNYDNTADFGKYFYHGKALNNVDVVGSGDTKEEAKKAFFIELAKESA